MLLIVGRVLTATALMVSAKLVVVLRMPSLAMRSIWVVRICPAAGVTVTVRLESLPPSTMLLNGTKVVFQEPTVTARLPAAVCASPMVNGSGAVEVPALIVWFGTLLTVGGVLVATPLTVSVKLVLLLRLPSLTVIV